MNDTASKPLPPLTQLRPLHSHRQQHSERCLGMSSPEAQDGFQDDPQLVHWASHLQPGPDKDTAVKAFVKLVSQIAVLDPGEAYCIQDSARGGFLLARSAGAGHKDNEDGAFSFVDCTDFHGIATDFSIGEGKALQLCFDVATGQVRLTAQASVVPSAALDALGCMLDDLILGLQGGGDKGVKWTQPSVLIFPLDAKKANVQSQLADFSSRYVAQAIDELGLASEADVEMVLPTTCTQSQLAMSFAVDGRNYISHSVLNLRPEVSAKAVKDAVETVVSERAIYRTAMLPCSDSLSPFAQVVLTPESWRRRFNDNPLVVHRRASASRLSGDVKWWLELAEEAMSLHTHRLYHIQVIEPDSDSEFESTSTSLLIISVAHCICDDASLEVLMSDIAREYAGREPLPRRGIHDAVFEWASNVNPETDNLWRESLKEWEAKSFGALSGDNINLSGATADYGYGIVQYADTLPWKALEEKSWALGATPLSILQASWSLLLHSFSESDTGDVVFGSVLPGHHLAGHAPALSVVPCRVALPAAQTIGELVGRLSTGAKFAQCHRHMSYGIFKTLPYNTALAMQTCLPVDPKPEHGVEETLPVLWTETRKLAMRYDLEMFVEIFPRDPHSLSHEGQLDNMMFKLTYREDVLSEVPATCILKQLATLTETVLGSLPDEMAQGLPGRLPRELLSTIPASAENRQESGHQSRDRVESLKLHSQFEDQAASTPDLLALSFYPSLDLPPIELSYAELDARANGLANILRDEDVDIIPLCLQRSVELYVAVLAVLKAGSAWCPIDLTSPVQRRTSLIARTQSKVLLTNRESLHLVEPCLAHESLEGVRVILLDQYADQKTSVRAAPRHGVLSSGGLGGKDLAYLLWTSGTTGEPKGVLIQHGAAALAMRGLQVQVEHDEEGGQVRTLQLSAYSFDVFVQDLFYTWGIAGSVIGSTRETMLGSFVELIWKSRPTHAHLTPSFGASVDVGEIRGSSLQYMTFIGEKLTEDLAEAWTAPGVTTRAYNTYGPTENAVISTLRRFYGRSRDRSKAGNVGFPLPHCTAYVVREAETRQGEQRRWDLVPRYGVGELAVGGVQMGKGYLGDEAKTARAFVLGGPGIGEPIYLTGDVVRLNHHGFEFLGRNDDLVKITGIRVELSEISSACASVKDEEPGVEHVETLHLPRPTGAGTDGNNKVLVTFVSVKKGVVDTDGIRARIFRRARDMLPSYMVPGHVVVLGTTMPRTTSNKTDRRALQEIYKRSDLSDLAQRDSAEQSAGHGEQTKLEWAEEQLPILQIIGDDFQVPTEPLSPGDSLAGLGFSSLQVTRLAWSMRRRLECAVGVLDLLQCETLGELVSVVLSKLPGQDDAVLPKPNGVEHPEMPVVVPWVTSIRDMLTENIRGDMRPSDTLYVLPAIPIQESLIVETMLEPRAYWVHRVFDLGRLGEVDGHRLKAAWTAAARRLDILRTIFIPLTQMDVENAEENGSSVSWARRHGVRSTILQLVRGEPAVCWRWLSRSEDHDLAGWAEKIQVELAPATTTRPPWAVTFAEGDKKMMLSIHHALYDSVSFQILLDTVAELYQKPDGQVYDGDRVVQLDRGMGLGLLPTASQRDEAASLWSVRLSGVREMAGALSGPFPDLTQSRQKQPQSTLLSRKVTPPSFISSASTPGSPSLSTLLQSAFGCVLASYLELKAVVLGHTVSQRILHPDLARFMGPAIATLPVVVRADGLSAEELWRDMARDSPSVSRVMHALHPVDVKKMLNRDGGSGNAPFPGLFVYHPAPDRGVEGAGSSAAQEMFREMERALPIDVEHPLALNIFEDEGTMELTGDGRRISQAQLELMLDQVVEQARLMLEFPRWPLDRLQNRTRRGLLSISGEPPADGVRAVDPSEKVSLHASENPEWIAVEEVMFRESEREEDEIISKTITYAQLDLLTNVIASRLASHEVELQPGDPIALYSSRDIKSLAATLAVFRAGYMYLPVDEDLPPARKQLLVRDAKAKLVITTERLVGDLDLDSGGGPPVFLMPDGDDDVDVILSWSLSPRELQPSYGGYLLYTSGSTGRPKGVCVPSSNLCHFIAAFIARLTESSPATAALGGSGKYLNLTSRAFDPHLTQMFVPWYLGHRVVIGRDRTAMLGSLQQVINDLGITHFGSVPSVLTQLGLRPEDVPSVKVVTTGGEKASSELLDTWTKKHNLPAGQGEELQAVLFNFYGPTEVTIGCLGHAVNRDSNARNLGLPLQGNEALLLCPGTGDEQVIARRGQPGELYIAGPQVAKGYLDRPVEDAKSFQTTSLLGGGDRRVYRTGDVMRMMHDGTLEFLGRTDQQTKIRGQRLEIDEVVSFLREATADEGSLDFAATVVVADGHDNSGQQLLLGFVARKEKILLRAEAEAEVELLHNQGRALTALLERIERRCEEGLPAFMVPTMLWVVRIPYLAASGKVDTKLLAKLAADFLASRGGQQGGGDVPELTASAADRGHALDPRESVVVAAVEEAIGSRVNATATSSLHRLGIDSLSAVHLVSLLRKQGFPKLNMADILSFPCTVASLALLADRNLNGIATECSAPTITTSPHPQTADPGTQEAEALSTVDLGPVPASLSDLTVEAVLPCLPLQAALVARSLAWLSANSVGNEDGEAGDVPYVTQFHYRLSRGTDVARWKRAAEITVASEAMLRTCFVQREEDGRVLQVVLRSPPLSPFDGRGDPMDMVAQINTRPPIRLQIRETASPGEAVVSLRVHHALFDGVAIDVLRKRLEQGYDSQDPAHASVDRRTRNLDELKTISNHCNLSDAQLQSTRRQWQVRLHGVRPCRVVAEYGVDNSNEKGAMARSIVNLAYTSSELRAKLQSQSQHTGGLISMSSAFQVATALCLARLTRRTSVVYGFVLSLRPLLGHVADRVDEFVFPCLNTLVQALSLRGQTETLPELARRVHDAHAGACQGTMPLARVEQVQRWVGCEERLFDSLLSINLVPAEEVSNGEPAPGRMTALRAQSRSDMALAIDVDIHADGKIILTLSSAGALTESQLNDVGRLFGEVAYSSADENARVEHFVPEHHATNGVVVNNHHAPNGSEPEPGLVADGYKEALACVQETACRLLRLSPSEMPDTAAKTTSLYQLGLDSITVLPFVKLINKSENIRLTPGAVIKARTVQGAARLVQEAKTRTDTKANGRSGSRDSESGSGNALNGVGEEEVYDKTLQRLAKDLLFVATPLQEGMLSASLAIASKAYTYVHTVQLSERALDADTPDLSIFSAAFGDTVQACEILRTRFIFTQDDEAPWVGIVSPTEQSDLVQWEMVRSDPPGRVQIRIHHALYDATSIQSVWRILDQNYRRRIQGRDGDSQEAVKHLFRPFARTVAAAQGPAVAFWANLVQDYSYTPLESLGGSLQASSAFRLALGEQELSLLRTRCRALGVTIKAALQLVWAKVLCESLYGQADIVFGEVVSTGSGYDGGDDDGVVAGPSINTVPMRVRLADQGDSLSTADALSRVQRLCDDARGRVAMASLRKTQALWRSSHRDPGHVPAGLFQSLFVFDGVVAAAGANGNGSAQPPLFRPAEPLGGDSDDGPAYDDYPLIVSFQIKNNTLCGKLRAKMTGEDVKALGSLLEAALRCVVSCELPEPVLDISQMEVARRNNLAANGVAPNGEASDGAVYHSDMETLKSTADAVVELVKTVLGTRYKGRDIGYDTKLVNAGIDSILAIRLSKLLKKRLGISASVFEIIKGARVRDIIKSTASVEEIEVHEPRRPLSTRDEELKARVAGDLGLPRDLVESVLPVLPGQRGSLEQWLYNGKRLLEAPWVYRVADASLDAQKVASCWAELRRVYEALRTTFVWTGSETGLVQVTLSEKWTGEGRFAAVRDSSRPIQAVIDGHVAEGNSRPSDLREPPARLSFLEASDGKAVVLRVHHALYDAWSIRAIERALDELLATGKVSVPPAPLEQVVRQITEFRQPDTEDAYWRDHLLHAQDTILHGSGAPHESPLGRQSKVRIPAVVLQSTVDALRTDEGGARTSAAIILAYARTLSHFTGCSRPTFGHHRASRSLSSADGARTLDLSAAGVPTLTVTPLCVDLGGGGDSEGVGRLLDSVQDHLAQLAKFAQADGVGGFCPRFNSYLNILYPEESAAGVDGEGEGAGPAMKVLSRQMLGEPLASDYFTVAEPSPSTVSTIEGLDTSHLCPHRLFLHVVVRRAGGISAAVSGDEALCGGDMATTLAAHFGSELAKIVEGASGI